MSKIDRLKKVDETNTQNNQQALTQNQNKEPVKEQVETKISTEDIVITKATDLKIKGINNDIINDEVFNEYNKTFDQIKKEVKNLYINSLKDIEENVSDFYKSMAKEDLKMIFDNVIFRYLNFISKSSFENFDKILYRTEKILATNSNFYTESEEQKDSLIETEISNFIPNKLMRVYTYLLEQEKASAFSFYDSIINNIKAQDFVLEKEFINVEYEANEFFKIHFPDYITKVNDRILEHICINYIYERKDKFDANNAQKDYEEDGFRLKLMHKSLNTNNSHTIFIRKNIHGFKPITDENYFKKLLSETKLSDKEKDSAISRMKDMASGKGSYFIVGETGSGKTTLLRQLILLNGREQNRITIEDTPELYLPDTISYVANKTYSIHDIFVSTLRMAPSSVTVGETRDVTILDILELSLTKSTSTTLHASTMRKCLCRMKMMTIEKVDPKFLEEMVCSTIDMFIFMQDRKITELYFRNENEYDGKFYTCYDRVI